MSDARSHRKEASYGRELIHRFREVISCAEVECPCFMGRKKARRETEHARMLNTLPIERLSIDKSGIGMSLAESLGRAFLHVDGEVFTSTDKKRWITDFKLLFLRRDLPRDRELVAQLQHQAPRDILGRRHLRAGPHQQHPRRPLLGARAHVSKVARAGTRRGGGGGCAGNRAGRAPSLG